MLPLLFKGLLIGFLIAAPVGPIGILCINRSLREGYQSGFIAGCGAATADGIYGCIAGFGLTFISKFLMDYQHWIYLIGGIFLLYLGFKISLSSPAKQSSILSPKNLWRAYYTTFFLTLTNPLTILSFAAILAGLGIISTHINYLAASLLALSITMGSLLWWLILSSSVSVLFGHKISHNLLQWVNRISGIILIIFGIFILIDAMIKK